jgi:hypothetical protein
LRGRVREGGPDPRLRAFSGVWKKYLKTNFEAP